jgi:hypothetical protein
MKENMHEKTSHSGIDWQQHERMHTCAQVLITILAQELGAENRGATGENCKKRPHQPERRTELADFPRRRRCHLS